MNNKLRNKIKEFLSEKVSIDTVMRQTFPIKNIALLTTKEIETALHNFNANRYKRAEELLAETFNSTEEYVPSSEDITDLRKDFELSLGEGDFSRNPDGSYRNKGIAKQWLGFQLYHNKIVMEGVNSQREFKVEGRWIIGGLMEDGYPRMSPRPHVHLNRNNAITEGQRLANEHGRSFALYRCHEVITPALK